MTILLYLAYQRLGSMAFSLVLTERKVANHVLVTLIHAPLKLRVVFVCEAFLHYRSLPRFYVTFWYIFLVCSICQLN